MKLLLSTLLILLVTSCGFISSEDDEGASGGGPAVDPVVQGLSPNEDFDGDLVSNSKEQSLGRSPIVADIPKVRIRFLQNYSINVQYLSLANGETGEFNINTITHQDNPDFKYRVGEVFIRNESFNAAASVGKFSGHSWGNMNEHDLTWVNYPEVDSRFYSEQVLNFKPYFNKEEFEVTNISVTLENNIKLNANEGFSEIKNLLLNFYYYDYEKESFEQLSAKLVERNFQAGINENFSVVIENVPVQLLATNYFQKGEFIISELGDYEIPSMSTSYKKLMASVRKKSVPVIFNTPLSSDISYVGTNGGDSSFSEILGRIYGNKVVIEQNKLKKINQFESNLPDFTYLSEVKELDKKGKWFVFTNKLRQHYLDHKFSPKDIISLSYITGKDLSSQKEEEIFSYRVNAESTDEKKVFPLGNITSNSRIHLQFKPRILWGEKINHWTDIITNNGSCSGNCYRAEFACHISFNLFEPLHEKLVFANDLSKVAPKIKLVVNNDEYSITDLVQGNKAEVHWIDENIHIDIKNISDVKQINDFDENNLTLKLERKIETTFNGVNLVGAEGAQSYNCSGGVTELAGSKGWPLSTRSWKFNEWQRNVRWDKVIKGHDKTYTQDFSFGVTSLITNFFN